jgi:hypothetical protein
MHASVTKIFIMQLTIKQKLIDMHIYFDIIGKFKFTKQQHLHFITLQSADTKHHARKKYRKNTETVFRKIRIERDSTT